MKSRAIVRSLFLFTSAVLLKSLTFAGSLNVTGDFNVSSNLTATALTLGDGLPNSLVYAAGDFRFWRDGGSGFYTVLETTAHQGEGPYSVATLVLNARDASEETTGSAQVCVGNDGLFHVWSNIGANNCFEIDLVEGGAHVVADQGSGNLSVDGELVVQGKATFNGGVDPPYLLLDAETRDSVAERVAIEVPPSKQTGAALFWNSATKQVEAYVANDGVFYDLTGKQIATIAPPKPTDATVVQSYRVDGVTGAVVIEEKLVSPRWRLKKGYSFDKATGAFYQIGSSNAPPMVVDQSNALELR